MPPLSTHPPATYDAALPLLPFARHLGTAAAREDGCADRRSPDAAHWFPTEHLFAAASDGARTRALLAAVDGQARLVDDLLAAFAAGAATMPPTLVETLRAAAVTLAEVQRNPRAEG
jgi:hypothetical protein